MSNQSTNKTDPLVKPLLLAASDEQIEEILSDLMIGHAGPVIKKVIGYKDTRCKWFDLVDVLRR